MRKVLPAIIAALGLILLSPVKAADYKAGPYAGVTAGVATGYLTNSTGDLTTNGIPVSGIVGTTFALGNGLVIGGEIEAVWSNVKGSQTAAGFTLEASSDYTLNVKARLGYAAGPALIYATAGPSWSKSKMEIAGLKDDHLALGVLAGGGVDFQITQTIAARFEATRTFSMAGTDWQLGAAPAIRLDSGETTIRAGLVFSLN